MQAHAEKQRFWQLLLTVYLIGLLFFGLPYWDTTWAQLQPSGALGWREPWRLLLGHWIHASWTHLLLNVIALGGWLVLWQESPRARLASLISLSIAVGSAVNWLVDSDFVLGLSGLLHGLFFASALVALGRGEARLTSCAVLLLLIVKVTYEHVIGAVPSTEALAGLPVAIRAHLIGVVTGAIYGGVCAAFQWRHRNQTSV